jgi:hypothetical protein
MQKDQLIICDCGESSIADAIEAFENTTLPYKKAKKLVTKCSKTCCRKPLKRLFDMVQFGQVDLEEIEILINQRLSCQI